MDTLRNDVKSALSEATPAEPIAPKKYYRVQLGAFSFKANADAMLTKVKAANYRCIRMLSLCTLHDFTGE